MKGRIHTLQNEIKTIEDMLDNLSGPMLELALEELRNLQFEKDLLYRNPQKDTSNALLVDERLVEHTDHAY